MYLKYDGVISYYGTEFLRDLFLTLLDSQLDEVDRSIKSCRDPDSFGLSDDGEYLCGMGFVACQRYLVSTFGRSAVDKKRALQVAPFHGSGTAIASVINATANYWKHVDEWDLGAVVMVDVASLEKNQKDTIQVIQSVTARADYTCSNVLAALTDPEPPRLLNLIPILEEWVRRIRHFVQACREQDWRRFPGGQSTRGGRMRIDSVSVPSMEGKTIDQFLKELQQHCLDTAKQIMRLSNELEDLKGEVLLLKSRAR